MALLISLLNTHAITVQKLAISNFRETCHMWTPGYHLLTSTYKNANCFMLRNWQIQTRIFFFFCKLKTICFSWSGKNNWALSPIEANNGALFLPPPNSKDVLSTSTYASTISTANCHSPTPQIVSPLSVQTHCRWPPGKPISIHQGCQSVPIRDGTRYCLQWRRKITLFTKFCNKQLHFFLFIFYISFKCFQFYL